MPAAVVQHGLSCALSSGTPGPSYSRAAEDLPDVECICPSGSLCMRLAPALGLAADLIAGSIH